MATRFREELIPWTGLPQEYAVPRADWNPLGGILPGAFALQDTNGTALAVGTGITRAAPESFGPALDCTSTNTGLTRAIQITDAPMSCVFVVGPDTTAGNMCVTSIASTGDKTGRIFVNNFGQVFAQHIGATTNASATTAQVFTFGGWVIGVVVFGGPTDIRAYARGDVAGPLTASSTTNVGALGAMTKLAFGTYDGSVKTTAFDGRIGLVQWFRKAFTADEALALVANPGLAFEPQRIPVPVAAAAGGSTGTLATTNANDTSSASGTPTLTGSLARTNANDTSSAAGTTTVTGTSARTNANDTSNASGSVGSSISGSSATANANDTGAASGTTTVTGTSARTNANDASAAAGTTTTVGTLARSNANDTASASGAAGAVTGTAAAINRNDAAAATGTAAVTIIGRRRRTRTLRPEQIAPPDLQEAAPAPANPLRPAPSSTSLLGDANALIVERLGKAEHFNRTSMAKRRAAIEQADEEALSASLMEFF
jgi:hypothetical protein